MLIIEAHEAGDIFPRDFLEEIEGRIGDHLHARDLRHLLIAVDGGN